MGSNAHKPGALDVYSAFVNTLPRAMAWLHLCSETHMGGESVGVPKQPFEKSDAKTVSFAKALKCWAHQGTRSLRVRCFTDE
jgi:hypothetical protein